MLECGASPPPPGALRSHLAIELVFDPPHRSAERVIFALEPVEAAPDRVEVCVHVTFKRRELLAQRLNAANDDSVDVRHHDFAVEPEKRMPQVVSDHPLKSSLGSRVEASSR